MSPPQKDYGVVIGREYGWLTAKAIFRIPENCKKLVLGRCRCGALASVGIAHLVKDGGSCGCRRREISRSRATRHGLTQTRFYKRMAAALTRCQNPKSQDYGKYGGRGIEFRFPDIRTAAEYVSQLPGADDESLSIDRIDNNGHYEPGNLRWATSSQQNKNKDRVAILHGAPINRWRPIETAPRDCTDIIMGHWFVDDSGDGYFGGNRWVWQASGYIDGEEFFCHFTDDDFKAKNYHTATHWMPMLESTP